MHRPRFTRIAAASVLAAMAGAVALAAPAHAIDDGEPDPVEQPDRPDLRVSALSVVPAGSAWSLSFTVVNGGQVSAGTSTLRFGGGPGVAPQVSIPSLAPGASRSSTVQFPRADCYVYVNATADATKIVTESNESNNVRTLIGVVPGCPPRYKVSAVSFTALDESGADWSGSDEAYFIFSSVSNTATAATRATQVYGSMDSGDRQSFSVVDQCVWGCGPVGATAPFGIGVSAQLWEQDLGEVSDIWSKTADAFQQAGPILSSTGALDWAGKASTSIGNALDFIIGWAEDDLLGTNTYAFSAEGLASALPNRGTSFTDTRIYESSDAKYSVTMTVSRVV